MLEARRVLIWQLGRLGFGPRYALESAKALRNFCGINTCLSLAEAAQVLQHPAYTAAVDLPVAAYRNRREFIARTLTVDRVLAPTIEKLRLNRPDVAMSVMPSYWDLFLASRLRRLGIPIVTIIHDATIHPGDWFPLMDQIQRRMIMMSEAVITPSDFVANSLRKLDWLKSVPQVTIPLVAPDFSELNLTAPELPRYPARRPLRLLLVGRIKAYKGIQLLFEALERFSPEDVQVRIAGLAQNRRTLERLARRHAVDLQLGWLSDAEFIANIDWADAVLLPYVEASQSGVIPVAFKRGRPVITTPVGGLPEQVDHGVTGLMAREASAQGVAEAIGKFIDRPDLLQTCAQNALRKANGPWSWAEIAPRFAAVLSDVVRSVESNGRRTGPGLGRRTS